MAEPIPAAVPEAEPWRDAFRRGVAPALGRRRLEALARALESDDPRLCQEVTVVPSPASIRAGGSGSADLSVAPLSACAVGLAAWDADRLATVGDVTDAFEAVAAVTERLTGDRSALSHFLRFWDETPRRELFPLVLAEARLWLSSLPAEGGAA